MISRENKASRKAHTETADQRISRRRRMRVETASRKRTWEVISRGNKASRKAHTQTADQRISRIKMRVETVTRKRTWEVVSRGNIATGRKSGL